MSFQELAELENYMILFNDDTRLQCLTASERYCVHPLSHLLLAHFTSAVRDKLAVAYLFLMRRR
jgi:hypothetical protein